MYDRNFATFRFLRDASLAENKSTFYQFPRITL